MKMVFDESGPVLLDESGFDELVFYRLQSANNRGIIAAGSK